MRPQLLGIAAFAVRKLIGVVLTLFSLATIVFFMAKLTPGDEARVAAGPSATPEQVEAVRERLGLTGSLIEQYLAYLGRLFRGDLGVSTSTQGSVSAAIAEVLPSTTELVVVALVIAVSVAVPLAVLSAVRSSGAGESLRRILVIAAAGMPTFWLGLVLQNVLGAQLRLLPISGRKSIGVSVPEVTGSLLIDSALAGSWSAFADALGHLILPAAVLAVPLLGHLYRVLRAEILRVMVRDHVLVARASGVPRFRLLRRHVLPQVATPGLTLLGVEFAGAFGGAVLVESIFGRDGLGSLITTAVANKDIPSVLGGVLISGLVVVLTSLVVDLIHLVRDPRVRASQLGARA